MKTSAKYFGLAVGPRPGNMSQNNPKTIYLWCHSQKICYPNQKNFLECRLEDWLIRLSPWTALLRNRWRSYDVGKATENCWF